MIINGFTITLPPRYRGSSYHERKSQRMNEHRNREMRTFHRRQFIWAADKAAHFHAIVERRMRERDFDAVKHYQLTRAFWYAEANMHRERYDAVGKPVGYQQSSDAEYQSPDCL